MEVPKAVNKTVEFSIDGFDPVIFDTFPDFIKDKINSSAERMQEPLKPVEPTVETESEELPF
jgi:hypothetical protein